MVQTPHLLKDGFFFFFLLWLVNWVGMWACLFGELRGDGGTELWLSKLINELKLLSLLREGLVNSKGTWT